MLFCKIGYPLPENLEIYVYRFLCFYENITVIFECLEYTVG